MRELFGENKFFGNTCSLISHVDFSEIKGATKSYGKITFASHTKIDENTTNISNCNF